MNKDIKNANFLNDMEKMNDFKILTKKQFLQSYSYLTEQEYDNTQKEQDNEN
jgi:hypothetical protein